MNLRETFRLVCLAALGGGLAAGDGGQSEILNLQ
jgi:hypothetical protein